MGATYAIPVIYVPVLMITHVVAFKLAGQKVTIKGTLKGDTLSVQEVTASK